MSRYDLHVHSDVSDGAFPPDEVVRRAAQIGLPGFALTDHDSTAGVSQAQEVGRELGVDVLLGCELSAGFQGASVHMLAYFIDPQHPRWIEELRWIRDDRVARAEGMVAKLRELGVDVSVEQVRRIAKGESIGRPHVAAAMVEAGVIERTPDAFTEEWIGDGGRAYVSKKNLTPQDAVALIAEAGGVSVIAHAIWIERDGVRAEPLIEELAALGLTGIEVNHPDHDDELRPRFGAIADRLGLIKTGSSDWHGNDHGGILGANTTPTEIVQELRSRSRSLT